MKKQLNILRKATEKTDVKAFTSKQLAILEKYSNINPQEFKKEVINELKESRMKNYAEVKRFISIIEKETMFETMHIPAILDKLEENRKQFGKNTLLNYKLMNLRTCFERSENPITLAVKFINELRTFEHIPVINESITKLSRIFESYSTDIQIYAVRDYITNGPDLIAPCLPIIENYIYDFKSEYSPRYLIENLSKYSFDPTISKLVEFLRSKINKSVNINEHLNSDFKIENVYSIIYNNPNALDENYIYENGDIYLLNTNKQNITKVARSHQIPLDFVNMNSVLESAAISDDSILFLVNEKKIKIGKGKENTYINFEDNDISESVNESLNYIQNTNDFNYQVIGAIKKIYENYENLVDVDIAKKISSKAYPDQYALVFKLTESKYALRIYNPFKNTDIFESDLNILSVKKMLKENLNFIIDNNELQKLIQKNITKLNILHDDLKRIDGEMLTIEEEINKINALDDEVLQTKEIQELKNALENELDSLMLKKETSLKNLHSELYQQEAEETEPEEGNVEDPFVAAEEEAYYNEPVEEQMIVQPDEDPEKEPLEDMLDPEDENIELLDGSAEVTDDYLEKEDDIEISDEVQVGAVSGKVLSFNDATGKLVILTDDGKTVTVNIEDGNL